MEFGLEEIKKYLPHREPFLFVDKVLTLNPGKDISGSIKFNDDSFFFKGHFPNRPVVPGVIIILYAFCIVNWVTPPANPAADCSCTFACASWLVS